MAKWTLQGAEIVEQQDDDMDEDVVNSSPTV